MNQTAAAAAAAAAAVAVAAAGVATAAAGGGGAGGTAAAAAKAFSVVPARVEDHLIAGTIAGLTSTGLLFPLDLIKTHYQVRTRISARNLCSMRAADGAPGGKA